jgi:cobalt-zinc-cadmium efflux system outer membrane protein
MCLPPARLRACILAVIMFAGDASGDENSVELTLREALARVTEHNPELRALAFEQRALEARAQQAAMPPNPELSIDVENVAGSGDYRGTESAEWTLALSQLIELGDKRKLRTETVQAEQSMAAAEIEIRSVDLAAETLRRFVQVAGDQDELVLTRRATELTFRTLTAVEQRVKAARSPIAELHRARVAFDRAQLAQQHTEHALRASRRQLAALWGESEPTFASVRGALYSVPAIGDFAALEQRMAESPISQRYLSETRLREAELRLAGSRRIPDVMVGAGLRRFEESGDTAAVLSFSVPLLVRDRNSGAIREAQIRRDRVVADRDADLIEARARLFEFFQELLHAQTETKQLRERVLPEMEEALRQTEYAYERGRYSYLEMVDAQNNLIDVNLAMIEAAVRYHTLLAEIESLTGQPLAVSDEADRSQEP